MAIEREYLRKIHRASLSGNKDQELAGISAFSDLVKAVEGGFEDSPIGFLKSRELTRLRVDLGLSAERISPLNKVGSQLDDSVKLVDLFSWEESTKRFGHNTPEEWRVYMESLPGKERGTFIAALGRVVRKLKIEGEHGERIYDATVGDIRNGDLRALFDAGAAGIGLRTLSAVEGAFRRREEDRQR